MKLINNNDYLLLIDEGKVDTTSDGIHTFGYMYEGAHRPILAHLPLKGKKIEGLTELPPIKREFDSYKFIKEEFGFSDGKMKQWEYFLSKSNLADFGNVLNLVEKAASKGYSLEDIQKAIKLAKDYSDGFYGGWKFDTPDTIIESLNKLPIDFEPEYEFVERTGEYGGIINKPTLKIEGNVLQGRWIWE